MEKVGAAMEGAVKRMASKPSAVATFTLVTALLPWIITFAPPLLRSLQVCGFATDAWRFLVGWLTTPVLFVLVNFVIFSIWATSSAGAQQQQQLRGGGEASEIVSQQDQAATAAAARAKRKETVLFLPPVSPVKSEIQRSVFSRSVVLPSPVITSTTEEEIEEPTIEEPVVEETVTYTPESPKAPATIAPAASAPKLEEESTEVFAHKSAAASKSKMELKISPPPPPSFLLEQQDRLKQARAAPRPKPKQVDRRNSAPVRSVNAEGSNVKTTQRSNSAVTPSSGGVVLKDLSFGDGNELSPGIIGTTDELRERVESAIANFYAQLRLQKKNEELG